MIISWLRARIKRYGQGFSDYRLRRIGKIPSQQLRKKLYRARGAVIENHVVIYSGCEIRNPRDLIIKSNSVIGHDCILDARGGLTIGHNVNLSTAVYIWTAQHDPQASDFGAIKAPVHIEDYAWISCRTVLLPGVTIGKGAVVAAGAVVTKNVDPFTIVGGIPAKKIGERNRDLTYTLGTSFTPFI